LVLRLDLRVSAQPFPNRRFIVNEPLRVLKSETCSPRPELEESEPARDLTKEFWSATLKVEPSIPVKFVARPLVSAPSVPREPDRDLNNDVCSTRFEGIVSDSVSVLKNEVCSARFEDRPNEPDKLLVKPLTSEPARDNEPKRVLESEMWSTVFEDKPNEAVRISERPLKRVVAMEIEPVRLRNSEICSIKPEDEPREPDKDPAKPLVSEPVRSRETARDLSKEM
jgi:hypothetical protein